MLINADCGGSNGARLRLWKRELQVLADELGIEITICHVPPGTSKWNKIGVSRTHPRRTEMWNYTRDGGRTPIGAKIRFDPTRLGLILGADAKHSICPGGPIL
jgi:hypothetical protein